MAGHVQPLGQAQHPGKGSGTDGGDDAAATAPARSRNAMPSLVQARYWYVMVAPQNECVAPGVGPARLKASIM